MTSSVCEGFDHRWKSPQIHQFLVKGHRLWPKCWVTLISSQKYKSGCWFNLIPDDWEYTQLNIHNNAVSIFCTTAKYHLRFTLQVTFFLFLKKGCQFVAFHANGKTGQANLPLHKIYAFTQVAKYAVQSIAKDLSFKLNKYKIVKFFLKGMWFVINSMVYTETFILHACMDVDWIGSFEQSINFLNLMMNDCIWQLCTMRWEAAVRI